MAVMHNWNGCGSDKVSRQEKLRNATKMKISVLDVRLENNTCARFWSA